MISTSPPANSGDTVESLVFAEQVYMIYRMAGVGLAATCILTAIVTLVAWGKVAAGQVVSWAAIMLAVTAARAVVLVRFRSAEPGPRAIDPWYKLAFASAAATALAWGYAGYLFVTGGDTMLVVLMIMVIAGVAAAAVPTVAAIWRIHAVYCVVLLLPAAGAFVARGQFEWLMIAVMVCVYLVSIVLFGWYYCTTLAGALQLAFRNDAAARVALAEKERVDALNANLQEEMSRHRQTQQELTRTKEAALEAAEAKSSFLASVSHEIRTPLQSLVGLANLAIKENPPETVHNYITRMLAAAHSLMGTISNVLDVSRIESGKLTIEKTRFRMRDIVDTTQAVFTTLAQDKQLALTVVHDPSFPQYVIGDPVRVGQVLSNFVSNAIKFSDSGAITVDVRTIARGPARITARISVADSGPGLSEEQQKALFDAPAAKSAQAAAAPGSTGLGIHICRQLVAAMNGRIGVESEPGKGSKFWAELPLELAVEEARGAEAEPRKQQSIDLGGLRILLVEDNKINQLVASTLLQKQGVKVTIVNNGQEALDSALHGGDVYDAVLMDLHMPVMDGRDATRELRKKFNRSQLPIIALTANALASEKAACLELGMNDYLTKPIVPTDLFQAIYSVTRGARPA